MKGPPREDGHEQRVVLVGLRLHGEPEGVEPPLAELERLAETAGGTVVGRVLQRRHRPDSKLFIGKGKAEEVAELAQRVDAHLVLFDNDLTPAQERNLEKLRRSQPPDPRHLRVARTDEAVPAPGGAGAAGVHAIAPEADVDAPRAHGRRHRHARPG
jgi:hypothetical protein